ncbi:hypothetical protein GCM10023094_00060 [Rhodococcus olei]|uniref:RES domain-containing protein n=1 Tax=Rhodococcus olei TaxID=2161675 RepID=A0ABP8NQB1_9NOCA
MLGSAAAPWYRVYHRDQYTADGVSFRQFGPLGRFDHHTPPFATPDLDPEGRTVLYVAGDVATGACEVFGEAGAAPLCSNWRVSQVLPAREVVFYDLDQPGAAMAIGALPALATGNENRELTQQWARAIFEDQPAPTKVEGIRYRTAYNNGLALALWDCVDALAVPTDASGAPRDLPLRHERFLAAKKALIRQQITVTEIADDDCTKCRPPT